MSTKSNPNSKTLAQGAEAKIILNEKENIIIKDRIPKIYRIRFLDDKIRKQRTRKEKKLLEKASKIINVPKILDEKRKEKDETKIKMGFINGKRLSETLDSFPLENQKQIMQQIGHDISKIHKEGIIHGDLTTSNMILVDDADDKLNNRNNNQNKIITTHNLEKNIKLTSSLQRNLAKPISRSNKLLDYSESPLGRGGGKSSPIIYFIDFGLGYENGKYEDKAVDLHLLKQALEAKHFTHWETLWKQVEKGYISIKNNKIDSEKVLQRLKAVEKRGRYKH